MIQVQEYFKCHLQRRIWQQLPADTQKAAVKMAEEDIMLALNCKQLDIGDLLVFCAVCEQALFLAAAETQVNIDRSRRGALKSETVEGIGKREYYDTPASGTTGINNLSAGRLSPRSELFLSRIPGYGEIRLGRG